MSAVKVRYQQAALGAAWAVRQPLVATVLGIVFGRFFRVTLRDVRAGYHPGDFDNAHLRPLGRACHQSLYTPAPAQLESWTTRGCCYHLGRPRSEVLG